MVAANWHKFELNQPNKRILSKRKKQPSFRDEDVDEEHEK